jgi:hypothetical protein
LIELLKLVLYNNDRWLTPPYDLISKELAKKEPGPEPSPAPSVPIAAGPAIAPAEPLPLAAETARAQQTTPSPATPVTASVEPKPLPAPKTMEAQPVSPPAPGLVVEPVTPQPSAAMSAAAPAPELPPPRPSVAETAALVARGDAFISMRDIASARLYYERAAQLGDGRGALRMGETFDPVFLARAGIRGMRSDEQEAISWYRRARDLGDAEADRLLKSLEPHQP